MTCRCKASPIIDSLNGYLNAMPDERYLIVQLHELLTYLGGAGVATGGAHERTIRDFSMSARGIEIGEPLRDFRGILTGVPVPETPAPEPSGV